MKKLFYLLPVALLLSLVQFSFRPTSVQTHKVDINQSSIGWKAYKVTGQHTGLVNLKSGELKFNGNKLTGGSFTVDVTSITCTDMTGEYATKLVNHLKSEDFFSAATHPTAKFEITNAIHQGGELYKIVGNLTIKNITKPVRFNAVVKDEMGGKTANAQIKIDRADYDVKYGSGAFFADLGDKTIYDEFDLNVKLVAK